MMAVTEAFSEAASDKEAKLARRLEATMGKYFSEWGQGLQQGELQVRKGEPQASGKKGFDDDQVANKSCHDSDDPRCLLKIMSLQRLKEVLLPKAMLPPPPEMAPFDPLEGEPIKVTEAQVVQQEDMIES